MNDSVVAKKKARAGQRAVKKSAVRKPARAPSAKPDQAATSAIDAPARTATDAARKKNAKGAAPPPAAAAAPAVDGKTKLVRDSFTMPRSDFALIDLLKARALNMKHPVKKSELLRAGLQSLHALDDLRLLVVLEALVPLKAGRPRKS